MQLIVILIFSIALYLFIKRNYGEGIIDFFKGNIDHEEYFDVNDHNTFELMELEEFWKIIERAKVNGLNYDRLQLELRNELNKLSPIQVIQFDNRFRTLRGEINNWDFWAAAYIINGGCSDDCFSDFRGWLIGKGKSVYNSAVKNIESLAKLNDTNNGDWEGIGYVASDVYETMTRDSIPGGVAEIMETSGNEWSEDNYDLKNRYPILWEKYSK